MEYLTVAEVLLMHARLVQRTGGSEGVRNGGLLESCSVGDDRSHSVNHHPKHHRPSKVNHETARSDVSRGIRSDSDRHGEKGTPVRNNVAAIDRVSSLG